MSVGICLISADVAEVLFLFEEEMREEMNGCAEEHPTDPRSRYLFDD